LTYEEANKCGFFKVELPHTFLLQPGRLYTQQASEGKTVILSTCYNKQLLSITFLKLTIIKFAHNSSRNYLLAYIGAYNFLDPLVTLCISKTTFLKIRYICRNFWVFGLCLSSAILKNKNKKLENIMFRKLDLFRSSGKEGSHLLSGVIEVRCF
jgi:hypothetical protein